MRRRTSIFLLLCLFMLFVYSEEREDPGGTLNKRVSFREKLSASIKSAGRICCNWSRRNRSVERSPSSSSSEAPSGASPQIPQHTSLRAPQPSLPQSSSPRLSPPQLSLPQPSPLRSSQTRLSPPSPIPSQPPWQRMLPSPTRPSPPRRRQEPSRRGESPPLQQSPLPKIIRNYSPEPLPPRQPTFQPLQAFKICRDEKKNVVLDCGHRICATCHERIKNGQPGLRHVRCPMCGDRFRSHVQFDEELHLKGGL